MSTPPDLLSAERVRNSVLSGVAITVVSLAFIASYVGALHSPKPHHIPIAVSAQVPQQIAASLERSSAFTVHRVAGPSAALRAIARRETYAAITLSPHGFTLTTAPAASVSIATLLAATLPQQLRATGQPVNLATVHPLPEADARGLVGFYTVAGWAIAGYLGATLFGLSLGALVSRAHTALRIGAVAILGLVIGLGGTLIAKAIGDVPGSWLGLTLLGALMITTAGSITVALQSLLGTAGTGLAILLFVIIGNPSSGGPAPGELLPAFWRDIGQLDPVGAAVTAFRDIAYFPDAPLSKPLLTLFIWLLIGITVSIALGSKARGMTHADADAAVASIAA
jgi:hypothetical protein